MHVFCDESGNTGADLLNEDQPVFAIASTNLDTEQSVALLKPLLFQNQVEAKYTKLKGNKRGQLALLDFFASPALSLSAAKVLLADKRYYLITHMVDKLIEPPLYEAGHDLYAGDAHVGLTNIWYYAGHTIFPNGHWKKIQVALVRAFREKSAEAFSNFNQTLAAAMRDVPLESRDFAMGLWLAQGRLDEFIGVFSDMAVFDPAADLFINMINKWMADHPGYFDVTHDRSKPLKRNESFLRTMMKPLTPRMLGYGDRQAELPLRVRNFEFGDSSIHPQIQIADLISGAAVDCLLAWSGKRPSSEYHERMRSTRLELLFAGGMLPSPEIVRKNDPLPGEKSLVDGALDFFEEAGYKG